MDGGRLSNLVTLERAYTAGEARPAARPLEAYIEVAARCNLRCQMCPITVDPRYAAGSGLPALLTPERFERLAPLFSTLQRAHLYGLGEPLLHPHLCAYAERLVAAGVEVWVTTNATLIDEARAAEMVRAGFARISVSIDGATRETYERIRRQGRWEDVLHGLRALGAARRRGGGRPRLLLSLVAMAGNLHELPRLVELCAEVGGDGVNVEELYDWDHPDLHAVYRREHLGALGPAAVAEILAGARERAAELGVEWTCGLTPQASRPLAAASAPVDGEPPSPAAAPALPWACSEPWTTVNVTAAGEVRTCCFNNMVLGHLDEQPFDAIWQGAGYAELRRHHATGEVPGSCAACVHGGRIKQSPYLQPGKGPREAALAGAFRGLELPGPGEIAAGPLVLGGRVPRQALPDLAEIYVDEIAVTRLGDWAARDGERFAARIPVPYLRAGKHRLSLHWLTRGGAGWEHRDLQVTASEASGAELAAIETAALPVELRRSERCPALFVDGRPHPLTDWICGRRPRGFLGLAAVDVGSLAPGVHEVELRFRRAPAVRFRLWRL